MSSRTSAPVPARPFAARRAMHFVLLVGVLSFFADFTYEGARSVLGPWLATMGASATAIGIVVGFGELLGFVGSALIGWIYDHSVVATVAFCVACQILGLPAFIWVGRRRASR